MRLGIRSFDTKRTVVWVCRVVMTLLDLNLGLGANASTTEVSMR